VCKLHIRQNSKAQQLALTTALDNTRAVFANSVVIFPVYPTSRSAAGAITPAGCWWWQNVESEVRAREEIREQYAASERRAMGLTGELEELRTHMEAAERSRKAAESELHEASDRVAELTNANSSLSTQKRKLENDIQAMHVRLRPPRFFLYFREYYFKPPEQNLVRWLCNINLLRSWY